MVRVNIDKDERLKLVVDKFWNLRSLKGITKLFVQYRSVWKVYLKYGWYEKHASVGWKV